jgi:hypothetical protein
VDPRDDEFLGKATANCYFANCYWLIAKPQIGR